MNKFIHIGSTILAIDEIVCVECQEKSEINLDELDRPERKITGYKVTVKVMIRIIYLRRLARSLRR